MKPIWLLNCGSSSIKYQVIDAADEDVLATGLVEKIGDPGEGQLKHTTSDTKYIVKRKFPDHVAAIEAIEEAFDECGPALADVIAVGHRTVHGGERFRETTIIDDSVIKGLEELSPLAPLHNPPGIAGIHAARGVLPDVPHMAIFDTAFFSQLPKEAYTYAIDEDLAAEHGIRRYGFHGTSHSYVSKAAAEFLGRDYEELRQIVCHLGNGASISAIKNGVAIETSMGFTPLAGLVMGTRSGDVDPGLHAFLFRQVGMKMDKIDEMLNKRSGVKGLAHVSDMRDLAALRHSGNPNAMVAFDVYVHRIVSYIGSYWAHLGGLDVITFTAGVGENDTEVRAAVVERLSALGAQLDTKANEVRSKEPRRISTADSPVSVLVIPTNEELAMARETYARITS